MTILWAIGSAAGATELFVGGGGAFGVDMQWETPLASPVVQAGVALGRGAVRFEIAAESQPTLIHSIWFDVGGVPLAMLTLGPQFGSDALRVGPYATAGGVALGGGGRFRAPVHHNDNGSHHDLEIRAGWLYAQNVEVMLVWSWRSPV